MGKTPTTVAWRFIAVLLLRNEDQDYNNSLASLATCLCRQRSELRTCAKRFGGLAVTILPQARNQEGRSAPKIFSPSRKNVLHVVQKHWT